MISFKKLKSFKGDVISLRVITLILLLQVHGCVSPHPSRSVAVLGKDLLHEATYGGAEAVRALLNQKIDVNVKDPRGYTPLLRAAIRGNASVVKVLLEFEADANAQDRDGYSALMLAAWRGHTDIVDHLLKAGADPNYRNRKNFTAIHLAAWAGFHKTVLVLLKSKPEVNVQDSAPNQGYTALIRAAASGYTEIVRALLAAGARTDFKSADGSTALSLAVKGKHRDVIALLCVSSKDASKAACS